MSCWLRFDSLAGNASNAITGLINGTQSLQEGLPTSARQSSTACCR
jgi:hypothetical protein